MLSRAGRAVSKMCATRFAPISIESRRDETRDAFQARMRKRYEISIDWPEPYERSAGDAQSESQDQAAPPEVGE